MDRRRFVIGGLAGLGVARVASAQRAHRIAVLVHGPERTQRGRVDALRAGLKQHGYVEGRNLSVSVHWNDGGLERLPSLAAELLKGKPDVVVTAPVLAAAAVQDLLATTDPGGDDQRFRRGLAYGGQQTPLGHLHGDIVVLDLITKRTGHAAATGIYLSDRIIRGQGERALAGTGADKRLLVTVAMQKYVACIVMKGKV